jgi:hypothetical protein
VQNSVHGFSPQTKCPYTLPQFRERERKCYLRAVPSEFNQGVKIYTPSNPYVMPTDLSAKKIFFFVTERVLAGTFRLLQYPVVRYYVLHATYAVHKAFTKHSPHSTHTGLLNILLAFNPTPQNSRDFADKPAESDCFRIRSRAASIFTLTDETCVHKFFTPLRDGIRGWKILLQFSSEFSSNSHHTFQFGLAVSPSDVCADQAALVAITCYKCVKKIN